MMEADSDQTTDSINSKTSADVNVDELSSPDVSTLSPLGKSRYGRTRKPKITEDFYDIDAVLDSVKEPKKSPRAAPQIKSPVVKTTKSQNLLPNKPKINTPTPEKSLKINPKPKNFVHITGDSPGDSALLTPPSRVAEKSQSPLVRKFFKRDSVSPALQSPSNEPKAEDSLRSDISQLTEDSLNIQTDVTKVLKIISTKSPDRLQNSLDPKGNFKAVLKTYSNKRKNFQKPAVVESFGLPDTPIFPIENEKAVAANEPKRIKNLDLATPCSESEVNIVDKKLLDTPWKIANINSDFSDNEILLGTYCEESQYEDKNQNELEMSTLFKQQEDSDKCINIQETYEKEEKTKTVVSKSNSPKKQIVDEKSYDDKRKSRQENDKIPISNKQRNKTPKSNEKQMVDEKSLASKDNSMREIDQIEIPNEQNNKTPKSNKKQMIAEKSPGSKNNSMRETNKIQIVNEQDNKASKSNKKQIIDEKSPMQETDKIQILSEQNNKTPKSKSPRKQKQNNDESPIRGTRRLMKPVSVVLKNLEKAVISKKLQSKSPRKQNPEVILKHLETTKVEVKKDVSIIVSKKNVEKVKVKQKETNLITSPTRVLRSVNSPTSEPILVKPKRSISPKKANNLESSKTSNSIKENAGVTKTSLRKSTKVPDVVIMNDLELKKEMIEDEYVDDELDAMNLLERSRLFNLSSENRTNLENCDGSVNEITKEIKQEQIDDVSMENGKLSGKVNNKKLKANKLNIEATNDIKIKSDPDSFKLGDLMWAKVGSHPYWPCLITKDPLSEKYKRISFRRGHRGLIYHVRFFGDKGRRSWVFSSLILPYNNKNDLRILYEMRAKTNHGLVLNPYAIKPNTLPKWENAVAEAESLTLSTAQERFDFFFDMFASKKERKEKLIKLQSVPVVAPTVVPVVEPTVVPVVEPAVVPDVVPLKRKRGRPRKIKTESELSSSITSLTDKESEKELLESPLINILQRKKRRKIKTESTLSSCDSVNDSTIRIENEDDKLDATEDESVLTLKQSKKNTSKSNILSQANVSAVNSQKNGTNKNNSRKESRESSIDEPPETFFKNPWQVFDISKRQLSTPLNEVNSECSLSDTDSLSKSSTNAPVPNTYQDQVARHKKNYLFKGVPRHWVCQVCKKPGDVLRCKGPCSGLFHSSCAKNLLSKKSTAKGKVKETSSTDESENSTNSSDSSSVNVQVTATVPIIEQEKEVKDKKDVVEEEKKKVLLKAESNELKDDKKSNDNNKVEIIRIDCDDSDFEHTLTPKMRLTPNKDFSTLSLAEKIDMKMKEIMQKFETKTRYADSTTDYTSSEESASTSLPSVEKSKNVQKKKIQKIKHVTADNISEYSSSDDLIPEGNSADCSSQDINTENSKQGVSSTANVEQTNQNVQKDKLSLTKTRKNHEIHVTGDSDAHLAAPVVNETSSSKDFKCSYCVAEIDPPCFVCKKEISSKNVSFRQKCSLHKCGKFYHPECLKVWPHTQWSLISTSKPKNSDMHFDTFVCPMHVCHTCASDDPHAAISRCSSDKVVKCLQCPATYHTSNYCVPAGTLILSTSQIVCLRHLGQRIIRKGRAIKCTRTINTPWCFICSKGGHLICCETCPTSVHTDCLQVNLLEDGTFICEDCESGRFPLYDEIVWVKLGAYRWWPALILFPNEIPDNIKNLPHSKGEFVVKFFGTHDHYWVSRGRVFLFQEGDRGHCNPARRKVDAMFKKSIEEATAAHQLKKIFKMNKEAEIKTGLKPPPYIRIKVNKPVGNVRLFDGNVSNTTSCECNPNQANPCGPDSDCLNRILLTECDPDICPAKERCNNQRFEKRQYPPLEPFKTPGRGWGLKTLAPIRKGDFVIEYVGEVIDEQEYQRRIRKMHEQKDENYYFLTIDKDRIIDAGPKGNLARFMNHCCHPNCETQKWTVNGDTRVGLFARDDIPVDTELTFNYNLECIGKEKKICKCGAPNCSGFIGVKAKGDESQKKPKKTNNNLKKKKSTVSQQTSKTDGPCFICGQTGDVGACYNKMCPNFYHLQCVNLEYWPEGKWVCPWHNCNTCSKRTIRCCVKCLNSYCPVHSEGNVRYDKLLGFICSEHDPTKESQVLSNQKVTTAPKTSTSLNTEETDVTSTTPDEGDSNHSAEINNEVQLGDDQYSKLTESITSTPIKKKDLASFVHKLKDYESGVDPEVKQTNKPKSLSPNKRKRGLRQKPNVVGNSPKRAKLSNETSSEIVRKPKPNYATSNLLDIPAQNEIKLSSSVPSRHLRTTRSNVDTNLEFKRFLSRQSELEKDLPIRKRSRPRCEASL